LALGAVACAFVLIVAVWLGIMLSQNNNNFTVNDNDIIYSAMTDEEVSALSSEYSFITKMDVQSSTELLYSKDNSLVAVLVKGEMENEANYYFIDYMVLYNEHYEFLSKPFYKNFANEADGFMYEQKGTDDNGLYIFYLLSESNYSQPVYMEVHCFENDISYILENL